MSAVVSVKCWPVRPCGMHASPSPHHTRGRHLPRQCSAHNHQQSIPRACVQLAQVAPLCGHVRSKSVVHLRDKCAGRDPLAARQHQQHVGARRFGQRTNAVCQRTSVQQQDHSQTVLAATPCPSTRPLCRNPAPATARRAVHPERRARAIDGCHAPVRDHKITRSKIKDHKDRLVQGRSTNAPVTRYGRRRACVARCTSRWWFASTCATSPRPAPRSAMRTLGPAAGNTVSSTRSTPAALASSSNTVRAKSSNGTLASPCAADTCASHCALYARDS